MSNYLSLIFNKSLFRIILCLSISLSILTSVAYADRAKRPMEIYQVEEVGLEIWVEYQPAWHTDIVQNGKYYQFFAASPANYHPPAALIYTAFKDVSARADEMEVLTQGVVYRAAYNYGTRVEKTHPVTSRRYGELDGFEATFQGNVEGEAVDVKIFVGHQPGKPIVIAHAYTSAGKLHHLDEPIRRAWGNLSYLK